MDFYHIFQLYYEAANFNHCLRGYFEIENMSAFLILSLQNVTTAE